MYTYTHTLNKTQQLNIKLFNMLLCNMNHQTYFKKVLRDKVNFY